MAKLKTKREDGQWEFVTDPTAIKFTHKQNLSKQQKQNVCETIEAVSIDVLNTKVSTSASDYGMLVMVDANGNLQAATIAVGGSF